MTELSFEMLCEIVKTLFYLFPKRYVSIWVLEIPFVSVTDGKFAGHRYFSAFGARRGVRCAQLDPGTPAKNSKLFPESDFTY